METEIIYGEPVAKSNHYQTVPDRKGGYRLIKDKAIKQYEREFLRQCTLYRGKNISSPFILYCRVFYANLGHDLDNSLKTILDCLQYCKAISNDNLCYAIHAEKACDRRNPRVQFGIQEIQQQLEF